MPDLTKRSNESELLDGDNIPFEDIRQNMKELNLVNSLLGGHRVSIAGLSSVLQHSPAGDSITICEIGCGGGDNLQAISKWCKKNKIAAKFIGIDINPSCIGFAKQQYPSLRAEFICKDYAMVDFGSNKPTIIFNSLFCHHFTASQLREMLLWMERNSKKGFFINDLQRHPLAYHSIKMLTSIFSKSYLVKNDAPLSVARGFLRREWNEIFTAAGLQPTSFSWKWAFRHLIVFRK